MKKDIDIGMIEDKIDRLFETARNLPDDEGTKLLEAKILPLIKIQRSFIRAHDCNLRGMFD